jgi:hypothetical protein
MFMKFTGYIGAVRLPSRFELSNTYAGETLRVSGWGRISDSEYDYVILSSDNYKRIQVMILLDSYRTQNLW